MLRPCAEALCLQLLHSLRGHRGPVRSCSFNGDGSLLATVSYDKTGKVWEVSSGSELVQLRGHTGMLRTCEFCPTEEVVATAGDDCVVIIWDAESGNVLHRLRNHSEAIFGLDFSPDGAVLCSGSYDNRAVTVVWGRGHR